MLDASVEKLSHARCVRAFEDLLCGITGADTPLQLGIAGEEDLDRGLRQ